jgi:hypothetical protein
MGLGFEIRDVHHQPVENERYTKLFVFHEEGESNVYPSKARFGESFVWGTNEALFERLTELRLFAESVAADLAGTTTRWLIPPDATAQRGLAAWTQEAATRSAGAKAYVCVVNYDLERETGYFGLPALAAQDVLEPVFSTLGADGLDRTPIAHNGAFHRIEGLAPGEGRVYTVVR